MDELECDEMLAQVESQYRHWRFREKTDQGIIIIELVGPTFAQINPAQLNPAQLGASGKACLPKNRGFHPIQNAANPIEFNYPADPAIAYSELERQLSSCGLYFAIF
ncbi:hypothetical protein N7497_000922 [Penicillium chrysogenum]|nr:hypothetical protein N7497_000922 [Penicillium chrysogenum]